jgi:hypothetical protein
LSGNLAKAPRFETVDNFDKTKYSLYPVHLRLDRLGFVWVNLDSANPPTIPWEDHFDGVDKQPRQKDFSMDDFKFDHAWELEGEYNWKAMVDNYNEVRTEALKAPLDAADILSVIIARQHTPAFWQQRNWIPTMSRVSKGSLNIIRSRWTALSTSMECSQHISSRTPPF